MHTLSIVFILRSLTRVHRIYHVYANMFNKANSNNSKASFNFSAIPARTQSNIFFLFTKLRIIWASLLNQNAHTQHNKRISTLKIVSCTFFSVLRLLVLFVLFFSSSFVCVCAQKTGILMEEHATTKNDSVFSLFLPFFSSLHQAALNMLRIWLYALSEWSPNFWQCQWT